jgi:hypothetical protein
MSIFHKSRFGMFGDSFHVDLGGFVADTPSEVLELSWEVQPTMKEAFSIAAINAEAYSNAVRKIDEWRGSTEP